MKKLITLLLTIAMMVTFILPAAGATTDSSTKDFHDQKLEAGLKALEDEKKSEDSEDKKNSNEKIQLRNPIIKLIQLIFTQATKTTSVVATSRSVATTITSHAIKEALKDGITNIMIDTILDGVSASGGPFKVDKFDDALGDSRVFYDYGTKTVIILAKTDNTIITVYKDTSTDGAASRIKAGRWKFGYWMFE
ncbi:hypothetical protein GCM10008018_34020 [Paenibacillus marchantiophytorum]|uniref:Uncharacterized protein n=1 Tax=Paenibacillus marchantiophytorum TaxID=1619310 RepID=A0ABQ1ESA6_9BACL|nr:hypothetical protein [Paenibacillus marchantiophytorum]GFZ85182.1 hypothetical protein GCM10008018_34020 [Paenibacillus marchantiophytorum]